MTLDSVLRCRFLGHAQIEIAHTLITPEAERLFALLAVLATEAGVSHHRDDLTTLLWSDQPEERGKHNLRQTLYKARQLGVQLETSGEEVRLPPSAVWCDWQQSDTPVHGEWLGAYTGSFSDPFASWVVSTRVLVHTTLRPRLVAAMQAARASGDLRQAEQHASQLLRVDPLNEEATLVLAECVAMAGAKVDALRLLDAYATEVGEGREMSDAVLPARVLRTRIAERLPVATYATGEVHDLPLVGREAELKQLLASLFDVRGGRGGVTWVWGPSGIGKSRLVHEVLKAAAMQGVRVARDGGGKAGPHPLRTMVARLLDLPGALGVDPASLQFLREFSGAPDASLPSDRAALATALLDLLGAVTTEQPVLLVIEHATRWDTDVLELVMRAVIDCGTHEAGVLLSARMNPARLHAWPFTIKYVKILPLDGSEMQRLLEQRCVQLGLSAPQEKAIAPALAAEGNPSFGIELLGQSLNAADGDRIPFRIREAFASTIAALSDEHRRVLTACWGHNSVASEEFLLAASGVTRTTLSEAITALLESGLLTQIDSGYTVSRLLAEAPDLVIPVGDTSRLLHTCAHALRESFRATRDGREAIRACQLLAYCDHRGLAARWLVEDLPLILGGTPAPTIIKCLEEVEEAGLGGGLEVVRAIRDEIRYRAITSEIVTKKGDRPPSIRTDALPRTPEEEYAFTSFSSRVGEYVTSMAAATDTTSTATERVRAACHALVLGDNLRRKDLVTEAANQVEAIALLGDARTLDIERARMIASSSFGDATKIRSCAKNLAEAARSTPDVGDASRALRNAAEAMLNTGDTKSARELLLESIRTANGAGYARQVAQSHAMLSFVAFAEQAYDEARMHINELRKHVRAHALSGGILEFDIVLCEAYLLLAAGDMQGAGKRAKALEPWLKRTEAPVSFRQIKTLRLAGQKRPFSKNDLAQIEELALLLGHFRPDSAEDRVGWALEILSRGSPAEAAVDAGLERLRSGKLANGCSLVPIIARERGPEH